MRRVKVTAPPVYAKPFDMGPEPELIWIPIHQMFVDMAYQRSTETPGGRALIETIAREFQWAKFQVVVVTARADGMYAVIDGQHRRAAALKCGLETLPCLVVSPPTFEAEADIFVGVNAGRINVQPYQMFWSKLAAGRPDARAVEIVCERAGVTIPRAVEPGVAQREAPHRLPPKTTIAVAAITAAIKRHGMDLVADALGVLVEAYPERGGQLRQTSIRGVAEYLQRYGPTDKHTLVQALRATDIDALDAEAAVIRDAHSNGARAFAEILKRHCRRQTSARASAATGTLVKDIPPGRTAQPVVAAPVKTATARAAAVASAVSIMRTPVSRAVPQRPAISAMPSIPTGAVTCSCRRLFRPEYPGQDKCNLCRKNKGAVEPLDAAE